MKKKMKLMLLVVAMAVIVGAGMNPVSAATLTPGVFDYVSFDKSVINVSVYPGAASYSGTGRNGAVSGTFGDGTVLDYCFYTDVDSSLTIYASGASEIIGDAVADAMDGNKDWADVWETSDPGVDFANPADFTSATLPRTGHVTGTIDIADMESGTVYFIYGTYRADVWVDVTMSGAGPDLTISEHGRHRANNNEFYIASVDFADAAAYDTITYNIVGGSKNRLMGVIIDGPDGPAVGIISPINGDTVDISDSLPLIWTNMDPVDGNDVWVDVWFGTEPNDLHPVPDFDLVVEKGLNTESWIVDVSVPDTYYWQVNSWVNGADKIDDANMIEGTVWSFDASDDPAPTVEIHTPAAMMTWSGEPVPLDATITNEGLSPTIINWSADVPDGIDVEFDPASADTEDTTVTLTKAPYAEALIVNAGFEDPVFADGDYSSSDPGWTEINGAGGSAGIWNPGATTDIWYGYSGIAPEGDNVAWVYPDPNQESGLAQVLTETFAADTTYTLTVQVGNNSYYDWLGYKVQLLAGGTVIAEDDSGIEPADDDFALSTVPYTYDAGDAALVGQPLEIRLLAASVGPDVETDFDDVVLTADPPFPAPAGVQTVTVKVAVSDAANPTPVEESIEIDVYQDACEMAKNGLNTPVAATDFNVDCITNLPDFAELASAWLDDYAATEAVERP